MHPVSTDQLSDLSPRLTVHVRAQTKTGSPGNYTRPEVSPKVSEGVSDHETQNDQVL